MERPPNRLVLGAFSVLPGDPLRVLFWSAIFQIALTIGVFAVIPLRHRWDRRRSRAREKAGGNRG